MERHYRFAGVEITVVMPREVFYTEERRLAPFAVDRVNEPHVFQFEIVNALPETDGICLAETPTFSVYKEGNTQARYIGSDQTHIRAVHDGREHLVQVMKSRFTDKIGAKTVLECIAAEHLVAQANGFIFHCSYIDWNGKAILFTAPSETGKSTQAQLWHDLRGAEIVNGDRAAVRLAEDTLIAEGIPFAGSSEYCGNRSLPLAAVVYLGQAATTSIRRIRGYEAFARIWEGCSVNNWDREDMARVSAVVKRVAETVPVFYLPCTPDESAVIALEEVIRNRRNV